MEDQLLPFIVTFLGGVVFGAVTILLWNKIKAGAASPANIKQEYEDYQNKVEEHFEETSKKFQEMTEQYQDLYRHLSVGATSLCRPESVAASLADESMAQAKLESKTDTEAVSVVEADVDKLTPSESMQNGAEDVDATEATQKTAAGENDELLSDADSPDKQS